MPTKVIKYECDICHKHYALEEGAERCERVHKVENKRLSWRHTAENLDALRIPFGGQCK